MFIPTRIGLGIQKQESGFRYWRIYINSIQSGGAFASIAEVELRGTVGGADLTTPATPATSSSNNPGSVAANTVANDGGASEWISQQSFSTPSWLRYDLGTATTVRQVAILPRAVLPDQAPNNFTLQGSADGTSFTDVKNFTVIPGWTAGVWQVFTV